MVNQFSYQCCRDNTNVPEYLLVSLHEIKRICLNLFHGCFGSESDGARCMYKQNMHMDVEWMKPKISLSEKLCGTKGTEIIQRVK